MFNRMNLPTRLTGFTALVIVSAAALSIPASAAKWSQATSVEAVCKRTNCWSDTATNGSSTVGCGVSDGKGHTCFICDNKKGKCYFFKKSVVEGKRGRTGLGASVGNTSSTSHTWSKATINHGETAPVKFGATINNRGIINTRMGGKH